MRVRIAGLFLITAMLSGFVIAKNNDSYLSELTFDQWNSFSMEEKYEIVGKVMVDYPKVAFFMKNPKHEDAPKCINKDKIDSTDTKSFFASIGNAESDSNESGQDVLICASSSFILCINSMTKMRQNLVKGGKWKSEKLHEPISETVPFCSKRWK